MYLTQYSMQSSKVYTVVYVMSFTLEEPSNESPPFGQSVKQYIVNLAPEARVEVRGDWKVHELAASPVVPDVTGAVEVALGVADGVAEWWDSVLCIADDC